MMLQHKPQAVEVPKKFFLPPPQVFLRPVRLLKMERLRAAAHFPIAYYRIGYD
jgi:hypothetical protein